MFAFMKNWMALFFGVLIGTYTYGQSSYVDSLLTERAEKDHELADAEHSPLQEMDRAKFEHLNYFEINEAWNKQAKVTLIEEKDTIGFGTSSGRIKQFATYALLTFQHNNQAFELIAYKRVWPKDYVSPYPPSLFVPFTDLTTGNLCYGGGRYMDIDIPESDGEIELDFNRCYNPYCAYGGGFSCPIPPKENFLDVEIRAGESAYDKH